MEVYAYLGLAVNESVNPFKTVSEVDCSLFELGHVHYLNSDTGQTKLDSIDGARYKPSHLDLHCLQSISIGLLICKI